MCVLLLRVLIAIVMAGSIGLQWFSRAGSELDFANSCCIIVMFWICCSMLSFSYAVDLPSSLLYKPPIVMMAYSGLQSHKV